ncbi:MAG: RluA family pseudouridine synthase [Methylophaga sp.]|nr:RluA family pseudouridine synthase [Methylophaga sp.]
MSEALFTPFKQSIEEFSLPKRFTFPFYYSPHPLCILAAKELQEYIGNHTNWQHNFGLSDDNQTAVGKMFGVLLVKNKQGEIGYLSAFSGKIADSNHHAHFVPPVFDMLTEGDFFRTGQENLNQISHQIKSLESNPELSMLEQALKAEQQSSNMQITAHRTSMIEGRKNRKEQRVKAVTQLSTGDFVALKDELSTQSIKQKNKLRDLTFYWNERINKAEKSLNSLLDEIIKLKNKRKALSAALQQKLFDHYRFLNKQGVEKSLYDIFDDTTQQTPPAGAGECATPKLLQYAFNNNLKPLAMAEFWWGSSPKSAIRQHKNFYAACLGKCQPILSHMLEGIELDDNPLLTNPAAGKTIEIVYEDDDMVVINKPAEFLSVPGKNIEDSVYLRMKQLYPNAKSPLIVHRLDMSTSGLMVIGLSKQAHKNLQKQFINRTVKKRYVALLDGLLSKDNGIINLPLRVDLDDRPRQLVCYDYGKPAETHWQLIEQKKGKSKVYFYPKTGRTHQLRVHSAHIKGLNMPIVGDDLYGNKDKRLHLHAEFLEFSHPLTKKLMTFQIEAEF